MEELPPSEAIRVNRLELRAWVRRVTDGSDIDAVESVETPVVLQVETLFPPPGPRHPGTEPNWLGLQATCDDDLPLEPNGLHETVTMGLRWASGEFAVAKFTPPVSSLGSDEVDEANARWGNAWPETRRVVYAIGAMPPGLDPEGRSRDRAPLRPSPDPYSASATVIPSATADPSD